MSDETTPTTEDVPAGTPPEETVRGSDGTDIPKGDFRARVERDPEFAFQQVREAQSRLSKVQGKFKQLGPIVDAVGGEEALIGHLRRLNGIVSNQEMLALIEEYEQSGKVPTATMRRNGARVDDDEEVDDEDPVSAQLRTLREEMRSELSALRNETTQVRSERGVEKLRENLDKFRQEFSITNEEFDELREAMVNQAREWGRTAQGLQALQGMSDYSNLRTFALGKLPKDALRKAFDREREAAARERSGLATDSPSRVSTQARGSEDAGLDPVQAFLKACKDEGVDPNRPLA